MNKKNFISSIIIINILFFFLSLIQLRFKPIFPRFVNKELILEYTKTFPESHKINSNIISFDKSFLSDIYLILDNKGDWYLYSSISTLDINNIGIKDFKNIVSEILDKNNIYINKIYNHKKNYSDGYLHHSMDCLNGYQTINLLNQENVKLKYKKKLLIYWNNLINPSSNKIYSCILRSKLL